MSEIKPFNVLTCPLAGSNLLEASAGTGKTFSLVFLYLRLLLEKGLRVEEILVATFTNAATAEISERIYQQLGVVANILHDIAANVREAELREKYTADALLIDWLLFLTAAQLAAKNDDDRTESTLSLLQTRLRLARAQFDEARIHSIDGFALQLLTEHADVVNSYVPLDVLNNDQAMIRRVYLQLAKDDFADLDDSMTAVGEVVASMKSMDLFALLTQMIRHFDSLKQSESQILAVMEEQKALVAQALQGDHATAVAMIHQGIVDGVLSKTRYKPEKLEQFAASLTNEDNYVGASAKAFVAFFSRSQLAASTLKNKTFDISHPLFAVFDALAAQGPLAAPKDIQHYQVLMQLAAIIKVRLADVKAEQMALTFADITQHVSQRATAINTVIKAALIDEAQDTNNEQLALFRQLFMTDNNTSSAAKICFFVGDPKQAIYGFRGANIYSYLHIQSLVDNRYVLTTNYRSSLALNTSVNTLFSGHQPFVDSRIDYLAINADKDNSESSFARQALSLVTAKGRSVADLAAAAAQRLDALLNENVAIKGKPLVAADIAILVRTENQAIAVRAALSQHGRAASFVGKSSVYATNEALLMLALLQGIAEDNVRLIRSLMLTPLFAYPLAAVKDDAIVNTLRTVFIDLAGVYEQRGFAVMFYRLLKQLGVGGHLLLAADGRRRLSNFIQLFELLQAALQQQSLSLAGLCDWLTQRILTEEDENELRLEDDDAMTIVTMHKAKGLEFPVVCLPFFDYHASNRRHATQVLFSHSEQLAALSSLNYQYLQALIQQEETAEVRRLAYVALTRAQYHNIVILQPSSGKVAATKANSMFSVLLSTLADEQAVFAADFVRQETLSEDNLIAAKSSVGLYYQAKSIDKHYPSAWLLDSFSRLLQMQWQQTAEHGIRERALSEYEPTASVLMDFPAGPRAGTALHEVYEYYMQSRQVDDNFLQAIEQIYRKHLPDYSSSVLPTATALAQAIAATADVPLLPWSFCLNAINTAQQSIEMKFFMHLSPLARQRLYQGFGQSIRAESDGFVHGYIDYLFCHEGKYYVLDYKSNKLGEAWADYNQDNMQAEMIAHHYDKQALIYTLALCKHLTISSEASYVEKVGGYVYLFIRGVNANSAITGQGIYARKVPWQAVAELL